MPPGRVCFPLRKTEISCYKLQSGSCTLLGELGLNLPIEGQILGARTPVTGIMAPRKRDLMNTSKAGC